jgi:hypothetical protein
MKAWARQWPEIERSYAEFKRVVQAYMAKTRELNQSAGQKARDRSISAQEKKALDELVARTAHTFDAFNHLV